MKLVQHLRAIATMLLYTINIVLWFLPLGILGIFFYLFPVKIWQRNCRRWMEDLPAHWIRTNQLIQELMTTMEWDVTGLEQLMYHEWYLLIANHQSWADVFILQRIFNKKIPTLKFFLKRELLWTLPFAGWACWVLGFPFVHRYNKAVLTKHPEWKGRDIETAKRTCQKFKATPTTVANFVEGTRFSERKHELQASPYQYLLRPKSAGIGFSLAVLGDFFHKILNVTIIYPPKQASLWNFLSGGIKKITVHIETLPITSDWLGDYQHDRSFRTGFQKKLNDLWARKDKILKKEYNSRIQNNK